MTRKGTLTVYGGPMFAGKTTKLLEKARLLPKDSFLLIKPSMDTRFSGSDVVTHHGDSMRSLPVNVEAPEFSHIDTFKIKTLLIDELNFFSFDVLYPELQKMLQLGVDIIGSGLLYDFKREPFGATLELASHADEFVELYARCDNCSRPANLSYRKVQMSEQVLLGAAESYGACCEACWRSLSEIGFTQTSLQ